MTWAEALKEYAKQKGQFVVPKKDTDDYKAVKAIQEKMASSAQQKKDAPAEEPKKPRKVKAMPEGVIPKALVEEAPKPKKKAANPALACEELKVKQAAKDQAVEVKVKRARKVKEADPAVDAPKRKPRVKKTEIIKQNVVLEF
jgi:hypothetical protein